MSSPYSSFNQRVTRQTEPILGKSQVQNNAGGFVYKLNDWDALTRFLMLGSEGGTYYTTEHKLTRQNAARVIACINEDGPRAVRTIVEISDAGRAPKNDPAIFALALAASSPDLGTRGLALAALPKICRIPTHLFHFLEYTKGQRGWGRGLKRAVAEWYNQMPVDKLAYELVKYQQRDGWSNRDVLRKSHPKTQDPNRNSVYKWAVDGYESMIVAHEAAGMFQPPPAIICGFEAAKTAKDLPSLVRTYNLTREMLPTEALTKPEVWEALLDNMPLTAMIRNLGNMSKVGLLKPFSQASGTVKARLLDKSLLKKARIHPIALLIAQKTYAQGHGILGKGQWDVNGSIVDALDEAFYLAFDSLEPTGKRFIIGVDCSGSMGVQISGIPMSAAEGAAAMALACAKVEQEYEIISFDRQVQRVPRITPRMRLDEVCKLATRITGNGTDCSVPMVYATDNKLEADAFIVITDNETWAGPIHASQALNRYRERLGIPAKLVAIGMTATDFTIADPQDPYSMNVAGFDASVPQLVQEFCRS